MKRGALDPDGSSRPERTNSELALGTRIRLFRATHQLTQRQLADRLGVTEAYISKLESNVSTPSDELCRKLGSVLGLDENGLRSLRIAALTAREKLQPEDFFPAPKTTSDDMSESDWEIARAVATLPPEEKERVVELILWAQERTAKKEQQRILKGRAPEIATVEVRHADRPAEKEQRVDGSVLTGIERNSSTGARTKVSDVFRELRSDKILSDLEVHFVSEMPFPDWVIWVPGTDGGQHVIIADHALMTPGHRNGNSTPHHVTICGRELQKRWREHDWSHGSLIIRRER